MTPELVDLREPSRTDGAGISRAESALCAMIFTSQRFVRYSMRLLA